MSATLSDGVTTITLPDSLLRIDEHSWSPVRQAVTPTIDGGLWIDVSVMQAGEPITLGGGFDGDTHWGVMTRADYALLRAWADRPGVEFVLTWLGTSINVVWRHDDAPALDARDVFDYADPLPTDWVVPTLKFMRI